MPRRDRLPRARWAGDRATRRRATLTAERIVRRLAERIAHSTLGAGHRLPTIAWGVADATGEATVDALVEAADRAMYRQKQLMRKRTPA